MNVKPNPKAVDAEPDDIEIESGIKGGLSQGNSSKGLPIKLSFYLAFQSIGIIYGDVGTSPLYVFSSTFAHTPEHSGIQPTEKHVIGALSLIIWTLTLIALIKYVFIVLSADDNGEGGTFALYSLLCRHARVSVRKNEQQSDYRLSTYSFGHGGRVLRGAGAKLKEAMEDYPLLQHLLLLLVMAATSLAIGDGVFTPSISVLSAVSGLRVKADGLSQNWVVAIACIIIVLLFLLQSQGTHVVGFLFAPVVCLWYLSITLVGLYNIAHHGAQVLRAFSPHYGFVYLFDNGKHGWLSLGGILLCITGVEAMFADLGHFTQRAIQLSFCGLVYPSLLIQYVGQAAYLTNHPEHVSFAFYKSVPYPFFWPMLVIATAAAIVASQAMITGTFSIIRQAMFLDCFPPVKIAHTSDWVVGQVYIPEANWTLMLLTVAVTLGFRKTETIGNAYGFAVIGVLLATTLLLTIIILVVWRRSLWLALPFCLFFGVIEAIFFSAVVFKVPEGAWVPLALSIIIMSIMYTWHYGSSKKIEYDKQNKVSMNWILSLGPDVNMARVPGFGLFYTDLVNGVPPIFSHFIANLPALHQVLVFVCVKHVPVPLIPENERYLIRRVGPPKFRMYRCVVRLGYIQQAEVSDGNHDFEEHLYDSIVKYAKSHRKGSRSSTETPEDSWPRNVPFSRQPLPKPENGLSLQGGNVRVKGKSVTFGWENEVPSEIDTDYQASISGFEKNHENVGLTSSNHLPGVPENREGDQQLRIILDDQEDDKMDPEEEAELQEELTVLANAKETGMVYVVSQAQVEARKSSWWGKKLVVNTCYSFLKRNFRDSTTGLGIPHNSLMEVGMVYVI